MNARILGALVVVAVFIVGVSLALRSCTDERGATAADEGPRYEVYVDISGSAQDRLDGPITDVVAGLVEESAEAGASITIRPLSDDSSSATKITDAHFGDPPETKTDGFLLRGWRNTERTRVEDEFSEWAEQTEPTLGTDLLGALVNASGPARENPDREVIVVLVSDGLNYTDQWRWVEDPQGGPGCAALADRLALPDLAGADVLIRTGGHERLDHEQSLKLEACWKELIHAAGGSTPTGWFQR